jgi:hypothetical protein
MMRELYEDFLVLQEQDRKPERHPYDYDTVSKHHNAVTAAFATEGITTEKRADVSVDDLHELSESLACALKLAGRLKQASEAIANTIKFTTEPVFTLEVVDMLAWRLAGNTHKLREGVPIPPWRSSVQSDEWCSMIVSEVQYPVFHPGSGRRGFSAWYFVVSGAPAGRTLERWHESGREFYIARQFGFGEKDAEMLYHAELGGCQAHVLLQPSNDENRPPYIKQFFVTDKQRKLNRRLLEQRYDRNGCPKGLRPGTYRACRDCPAGFDRTQRGNGLHCELAVRRKIRKVEDAHAASEDTGGLPVVCTGQGLDLLHAGGDPIGPASG